MKRVFCLISVWTLLATSGGYASALEEMDTMRCGSKLVQVGDTKIDILSKCGEPALREKIKRGTSVKKSKSTSKSGSKSKPGSAVEERSREDDQWTYDFGPRDFLYTLTFEGVALKSIGRGGRGTRR